MKFYGEILIFSMLLLTNGRILFLKRAKKDAIVMLAPLALLLSILQIIAWGVDFFTICALIIIVYNSIKGRKTWKIRSKKQ